MIMECYEFDMKTRKEKAHDTLNYWDGFMDSNNNF